MFYVDAGVRGTKLPLDEIDFDAFWATENDSGGKRLIGLKETNDSKVTNMLQRRHIVYKVIQANTPSKHTKGETKNSNTYRC